MAFTPCWSWVHGARSCAVFPAVALSLSVTDSSWVDLAQRGVSTTGLAVNCCPEAPPERIRLSRIRYGPPAFDPVHHKPVESVSTARAPS